MCVFQSNLKNNKLDCSFSKIEYLVDTILCDEQGFCIFHSKNDTWKTEQNFLLHLEQLIDYFENEPLQEKIVLEDIFFTGAIKNLFNNKEFKKDLSFNRSIFIEDLTIDSSTFKSMNFNSTVFNKVVCFINLSIDTLTFEDTFFKSKLSFTDIQFKNNFFMKKSHLSGGISILNSIFHSMSFFENIKTNIDSSIRQGITFKNIHFKGFTSFESSEFNSLVDFKKITINNTLAFYNTHFNYNEPMPVSHSVNFNDVTVKEKGRLEFKGNSNNKMFSKVQDVGFINENIEGTLLFEHTDFTKFSLSTKDRFISATKSKNAKVFIGAGCIKYYNQTPLKSIEISDENQNLIVELCNTFIDYFIKNGGFNLGVQFVDKTDQNINFFYFSDEVISFEKFEAQLQKSEQNMWRLIKIDNDNLSAQPPKNDLPSKIINATDTIVNLFGLVLKIGSRIPLGLISKEDISHIVNTTLPINTKSNNGLIVNQIVLFGIKNSQSIQVKKIN